MQPRRSDWMGFGKESTGGPATPPKQAHRVIPMGSDVCLDCDAIKPFDQLEWVSCDESGDYYRCKEGCS